MPKKSLVKLCSFTVAIAVSACAGYLIGYNRGFYTDDHITAESPVITVPVDYLAGLEPVPYVRDGSFSFDTFMFTNDKGQEMCVPLPSIR